MWYIDGMIHAHGAHLSSEREGLAADLTDEETQGARGTARSGERKAQTEPEEDHRPLSDGSSGWEPARAAPTTSLLDDILDD